MSHIKKWILVKAKWPGTLELQKAETKPHAANESPLVFILAGLDPLPLTLKNCLPSGRRLPAPGQYHF